MQTETNRQFDLSPDIWAFEKNVDEFILWEIIKKATKQTFVFVTLSCIYWYVCTAHFGQLTII
jgi:hypothetical protein